MAKILVYDIESAPNIAYVWGKYEQNVLAYEREGYMLCFAYQWLGEGKTKVVALPDFELYKTNPHSDKELVTILHQLFEEADIIIAHNGDQFDIKYSNGRFIVNGLHPPSNYRTIDTLKIARQMFKLNSNKLDDLGRTLGIGRKVETGGFKLWLDCLDGDMKAWSKMKKYNKQDVNLLIDVYLRLRGWKKNHPNLNILDTELLERPLCPTCKGVHVQKRGLEFKGTQGVQRWKCMSDGCGANLYTNLKGSKLLSS